MAETLPYWMSQAPRYEQSVPYHCAGSYESMLEWDSAWIGAVEHMGVRMANIWKAVGALNELKKHGISTESGNRQLGFDDQEYDDMMAILMLEINRIRYLMVEQATPRGFDRYLATRTQEDPFPRGV